MFPSFYRQILLLFLAFSLSSGPAFQSAHGAVIGTQAAIDLEERADRVAYINTVLARQDVRDALIDLGVSPEDAVQRVDLMTDAELQQLETQLDRLPAGGTSVIGVVGIVAIVLIILELLDVTDLFTAF